MQFALQLSIILIVFSFGLNSTWDDALFLLRFPSLLARSLLSMNIIMPVLAVLVIKLFNFHPAVEVALVALALSPVPPLLPRKGLKAGCALSYAFGLLFATAVLAIVLVPLGIALVAEFFDFPAQLSIAATVRIVLLAIIAPFLGGIVVRRYAPAFAERIVKPISTTASVMLVVGVLPILFTFLPSIISLIGNGTVLVLGAFVLVGLATGHLLGGPDPDNCTILALYTAVRHPAIAMTIASANQPEKKLVPAAVFLYLILNTVMAIPYIKRQRRRAEFDGPKPDDMRKPI
jgi:BASS family bile acid:Na+ symporter